MRHLPPTLHATDPWPRAPSFCQHVLRKHIPLSPKPMHQNTCKTRAYWSFSGLNTLSQQSGLVEMAQATGTPPPPAPLPQVGWDNEQRARRLQATVAESGARLGKSAFTQTRTLHWSACRALSECVCVCERKLYAARWILCSPDESNKLRWQDNIRK